jgi:transposase
MTKNEQARKMKDLKDQGLPLRAIAKRFGVSYETARRWIKELPTGVQRSGTG